VRYVIRAGPGRVLVDADQDNVELRVLAAYAPGGELEKAFARTPQQMLAPYTQEVARSSRAPPIPHPKPWRMRSAVQPHGSSGTTSSQPADEGRRKREGSQYERLAEVPIEMSELRDLGEGSSRFGHTRTRGTAETISIRAHLNRVEALEAAGCRSSALDELR
jgi:hypothetical protein